MSVNRLNSPFLDRFFTFVTNLGNGIVIVAFGVILCFRSIYLGVALVTSGIFEAVISSFCKRILFPSAGRPMSLIDESLVHVVPHVEIHTAMTFPSGHTVTIFGLCVFLALAFKNNYITILLALLSGLVAISRVYLLQHFVADIAGGALIGSFFAGLIYHSFEQMNKPQWMNIRLEVPLKSPKSKHKFS